MLCGSLCPCFADDGNECTVDACDANNMPVNAPSLTGSPCSFGVCNGMGSCVQCLTVADCTNLPPMPCNATACIGGFCTYAADPDGTSCNDNDACTAPDICSGGACTSMPMVCPPTQGCIAGGTCVCVDPGFAMTDYAVGSVPWATAVADLNGDTFPDLAVTNNSGHNVSVLHNDGTGAFVSIGNFPVGQNPRAVVAAELNGGLPDLAVADTNSGTVTVLFNNGNNTFTPTTLVPGFGPMGLVAVDLNNDSLADLAVTNYSSHTVSVFLNNGNGTFASKIDLATAQNPIGITASDFDGDTLLDLAVTSYSTYQVSVFRNTGAGTFAPPMNYATGTFPRSVATGDLDGDSHPDLVVTNVFDGDVSVLRNTGAGTFAPEIRYVAATSPESIAVADLNGDTKPDIAATGSYSGNNQIAILLNRGDATFADPLRYFLPTQTTSVTAGDLNGDTKPELIVTNAFTSTITIMLNACMP